MMAGQPAHPKWDMSNWSSGDSGVTLFQALGITKGTIQFPKLTTILTSPAANAAAAAQAQSQAQAKAGTGAATGTSIATGVGAATGGLGGTGAINGCSAAQTKANQALGRSLAAAYGWGTGQQWTDLNNVVMAESGWCNVASNPSSAYGIGQFLNSTWATVGYTKTSDPKTQILAMLKYIKGRYGTPSAAWKFHLANNYY